MGSDFIKIRTVVFRAPKIETGNFSSFAFPVRSCYCSSPPLHLLLIHVSCSFCFPIYRREEHCFLSLCSDLDNWTGWAASAAPPPTSVILKSWNGEHLLEFPFQRRRPRKWHRTDRRGMKKKRRGRSIIMWMNASSGDDAVVLGVQIEVPRNEIEMLLFSSSPSLLRIEMTCHESISDATFISGC